MRNPVPDALKPHRPAAPAASCAPSPVRTAPRHSCAASVPRVRLCSACWRLTAPLTASRHACPLSGVAPAEGAAFGAAAPPAGSSAGGLPAGRSTPGLPSRAPLTGPGTLAFGDVRAGPSFMWGREDGPAVSPCGVHSETGRPGAGGRGDRSPGTAGACSTAAAAPTGPASSGAAEDAGGLNPGGKGGLPPGRSGDGMVMMRPPTSGTVPQASRQPSRSPPRRARSPQRESACAAQPRGPAQKGAGSSAAAGSGSPRR